MPRLVSLVLLLALSLALAGCGSSSDEGSAADTGSTDATSAAVADEGGASAISLPDGWAMTDALGAEDVGTITGKTMEVFPEASSAAQDGKPASGYMASGVDGSKIYVGADVQGGEAGYESQLSFAGSSTDVSGVGDQAAVVTFSDGRAGLIARKGDAVIRVDWDPKVYTDDPADFGSSLANALLAKMFQ